MENKKEIVPQINPETGLSVDYINEFIALSFSIQYKSKDNFLLDVKNNLPKKYEERFNSKYENVKTVQNELKIKQLDKLVNDFIKTFSSEENINNYSTSNYDSFKKQVPELVEKEFQTPENMDEFDVDDFAFDNYRLAFVYFLREVSNVLGVNQKISYFFEKA